MILVSSCLLGIYSKFDGTLANTNELLLKYANSGKFIPICPEQLGGLPTPRQPAEIANGSGEDVIGGNAKVIDKQGSDVSEQFIKGAKQVLYITKNMPITAAILKDKSPSCGSKRIADGSFNKVVKDGMGVTCALLRQNNIPVFSEEEINEELLQKLLEE